MISFLFTERGEIAIGTLIAIAALTIGAISGSYAFTAQSSSASEEHIKMVSDDLAKYKLEQAIVMGELRSDIRDINTKLSLLLKANGIKQ